MAIDKSFIGKQEPMKIESIPLDPERLEIVKEILAQNRMILEMILEPMPRSIFNLSSNNGIDSERLAKEIKKFISREMNESAY